MQAKIKDAVFTTLTVLLVIYRCAEAPGHGSSG